MDIELIYTYNRAN